MKNELWRKLRNENNPLHEAVGELLDERDEAKEQEQAAALDAEKKREDAVGDLRKDLEAAESVIEDKLAEIDTLKSSLALAHRLGRAATKRRGP